VQLSQLFGNTSSAARYRAGLECEHAHAGVCERERESVELAQRACACVAQRFRSVLKEVRGRGFRVGPNRAGRTISTAGAVCGSCGACRSVSAHHATNSPKSINPSSFVSMSWKPIFASLADTFASSSSSMVTNSSGSMRPSLSRSL